MPLPLPRSRPRFPSAAPLLAAALVAAFPMLSAAGCGGATASGPPPEPDAAFAEIQVHEATIARATHLSAADPAADPAACAERCRILGEAREAAARICELAEAMQDNDALSRCRAARRATEGAGENSEPGAGGGLEGGCSCSPNPTPNPTQAQAQSHALARAPEAG